MDAIAHRFPAGLAAAPERLALLLAARLALAGARHADAACTGAALVLPVRPARDDPPPLPDEPAEPEAYPTETPHSGRGARTVERDLGTGRTS